MKRVGKILIWLYNASIWAFRALGMLVAAFLIVMAAYVCMNGGLMNGDRSLVVLLTAGAAVLAVGSWQTVRKDQ
jgi:peptidoglycan/LPS O-acetylase OafA/YrhL